MPSSVMVTERKAYSVAEIARQHGVSKAFVRLEIERGRLEAIRLGRRVLVPAESIRNWWKGEAK
jgi:excisionase family DNA binding protein